MRVAIAWVWVVLSSTTFCTGCGDDGGDAVDAAVDAEPCDKLWNVMTTGSATQASATVQNGKLIMSVAGVQEGAPLTLVYAAPLTGDVDVTYAFEGWVSGGPGAFAQASLSAATFVIAGIGTTSGGEEGISVAFEGEAADEVVSDAIAGSFQFVRAGDQVTATTAISGAMASGVGTIAGPLQTGIQLGANSGDVDPTTRIQVGEVTITDDSGTVTDTFACNSLNPPI
jgi:hypothetical protein